VRRTVWVVTGLVALAAVPALCLRAQAAAPQAPATWLHVRVAESKDASKVSLNLPLAVVEAALSAAPDTLGSHGRIHLGHHDDVSLSEFRRIWKALKATGDAEFISVEEADQTVHVERRGEQVLVHVQKPKGTDQVQVQIPVSLVDALLSGEGEDLNVSAAIGELQKQHGDIVKVDDGHGTVRIWLDSGN
jgi:hypothetical protein